MGVQGKHFKMNPKVSLFLDDERGNATMEFVIVFPLVMWFFLTIFETGFIMTRQVILEHALDISTRNLRLGLDPGITHDQLKSIVCANANILVHCDRDLILEVVEFDLSSAYPWNEPNCYDRTEEIDPTITFNPGGRNRLMFVRACMLIDPIFPGLGITMGLVKDKTGAYQMVAYSAFMNEPA